MPVAAVDKDNGAVAGQDEVRGAGQLFLVQSEAVSGAVENAPQQDFRLGVLRLNAGHHTGAGGFIDYIHD